MKKPSSYPLPFVVLMVGLALCIPISAILAAQHSSVLAAFGFTLVGWWFLGFILYTVFFDMKHRWPHLSLSRRIAMLIPDADLHDRHDAYAKAARARQRVTAP